MKTYRPLILWGLFSVVLSGVMSYALPGSDSAQELSSIYLPGETTSGHYQIELKCSACHDAFGGVREESCLDCHDAELKASRNTHPVSKFRDPSNIPLLEKIDATRCITCHREHDPHRTGEMGLTVPEDYCSYCHQDVADQRPSHKGMEFNTCTNAGCHNYHDNTALYEKFLDSHFGEPDIHEAPQVAVLPEIQKSDKSLTAVDLDWTDPEYATESIVSEWATTTHALAGVNCSGCHSGMSGGQESGEKEWSVSVSMETCSECHQENMEEFQLGKHGMRLAVGLEPMSPAHARLPMHTDAAHQSLSCNSCHQGHRFDRQYAAVDACLKCHADSHSVAYKESSHFQLWQRELKGEANTGTGVSCATCHMPRLDQSGEVSVQHNQNFNLEPNEKMFRSVCQNCHGLQFSLDALADRKLIETCYDSQAESEVPSLKMVREWFESREKKRKPKK